MSKYRYYKGKKYEFLVENDSYVYALNKDSQSIKRVEYNQDFHEMELEESAVVKFNLVDMFSYMLVIVSFYCFAHILKVILFSGSTFFPQQIFFSTMLLLIFTSVNIIAHELAHFFTMRLFGRETKGFIFKKTKLYVGVAVDTYEVYMLPKFRRFIVFYSGMAANIFLVWGVIVFFPQYRFSVLAVIMMLIISAIPGSDPKTDGYNILNYVLKKTKSRV